MKTLFTKNIFHRLSDKANLSYIGCLLESVSIYAFLYLYTLFILELGEGGTGGWGAYFLYDEENEKNG